MEVPEYKSDDENEIKKKNNYISLVYTSIILKHMFAQIISGLIEYIELYDSDFDTTVQRIFNSNSLQDELDTTKYSSEHKIKPHLILMDTIKSDKNFSSVFKINKFSNKIDLNDLLLLKFKGNDIISLSTIKSLEFALYMNQPNKWSVVGYNNICRLRNILFLYTNIKYKKMEFNASMLIQEDRECTYLTKNIPHEFLLSNNSYRTDPAIMYLYKRRFYSTYQANRIFLYRVILRLLLYSVSSFDLISNIKGKISNIDTQNNVSEKSICERNKYIYIYYDKNKNKDTLESKSKNKKNNNINNIKIEMNNEITNQQNNNNSNNSFYNTDDKDYKPKVKKIKVDKENNFKEDNCEESISNTNNDKNKRNINSKKIRMEENNDEEKIKYWINQFNYMEMTKDETNDFISSCIYHQVVFILKNILSKCIDFILNQNMYFLRLAKYKETKENKSQYYETPCVISLYEYGIIYLSKYVANHGNDNYDDLVTFSTDIEELNKRLKNNYNDKNWYVGRQEVYDNPQSAIDQNKECNEDNKNIDDLKNIFNIINNDINIDNNNSNISQTKVTMECDDNIINSNNLCEQILDLIRISEGKDDINIGQKLQNLVDLSFTKNIKEKCHTCKNCLKNTDFDNNKEMFIEVLKLLKYFINHDEYIPRCCNIYKYHDNINNYLYTNQSLITYKYYYNELIDMEKYIKGIHDYNENFKYLVNKANNAIKKGMNSFEIDTHFRNSFF